MRRSDELFRKEKLSEPSEIKFIPLRIKNVAWDIFLSPAVDYSKLEKHQVVGLTLESRTIEKLNFRQFMTLQIRTYK